MNKQNKNMNSANAKPTVNEFLYHYTSVAGFEGIITSHSLRMTESNFLNDPADCRLFISLIEDYLIRKPEVIFEQFSAILSDKKRPLASNKKEQLQQIYQNNGFIDYIKWIHENISLYIASFTDKADEDTMNMWNYYGKNGVELTFAKNELLDSLKSTLDTNEFLAETQVIYVKKDAKLEDIKDFPALSELIVMNNQSPHMFKSHQEYIEKKSIYKIIDLYSTNKMIDFVKNYIYDYMATLKHLLTHGDIEPNLASEIIFRKVFDNIKYLNNHLYWKYDLPHYMLLLSALIKPDTYANENEHRIIYYKYSFEPNPKEEYNQRHISSGDFIYPYISLERKGLLGKSLKAVTLSPLTNNLPIEKDKYISTLKKFLASKGFTDNPTINISNHKIRW